MKLEEEFTYGHAGLVNISDVLTHFRKLSNLVNMIGVAFIKFLINRKASKKLIDKLRRNKTNKMLVISNVTVCLIWLVIFYTHCGWVC